MDIERSAYNILERVREKGAEGDLIIDEGQTLSLRAQKGQIEEQKVSSNLIFGLRVVKESRVGTAYSEASNEDALDSMVNQALLNASLAKIEPDETITDISGSLRTDDEMLCPVDNVSIEEKIAFTLSMEEELLAKEKIKNVPYNGVSDSIAQRSVFTTSGLYAKSKQRYCSASAHALMEYERKTVMEGSGKVSRKFEELDYLEIVEETYSRCAGLLDGEAIPTRHYDVILDQEYQPELFSTFASMFSAQSAKDGVNPMRDKVGELIADTQLNVSDNPLLIDGFGYTLFDSEGTKTVATSLIKDGYLQTLAHNSATANYFGVRTTGHASRSPKSSLGINLHQLHVSKGNDSESILYAGEYLLITDLAGLHSGANPISGQFSFGASGYLMKDGARVCPVRNITIAGNFYDMLKKVTAIGDQLFWNQGRTCLMPHIRFSDVAISGS